MSECSVPNAVLQDRAWQQTPPTPHHTHTHARTYGHSYPQQNWKVPPSCERVRGGMRGLRWEGLPLCHSACRATRPSLVLEPAPRSRAELEPRQLPAQLRCLRPQQLLRHLPRGPAFRGRGEQMPHQQAPRQHCLLSSPNNLEMWGLLTHFTDDKAEAQEADEVIHLPS